MIIKFNYMKNSKYKYWATNLILIIIGVFIGWIIFKSKIFPAHKTPDERQKYVNLLIANPKLVVNDINDLRDVLGQDTLMQMFEVARNYTDSKSVKGMKYDLIFQWKKGDWIKFIVIPENVITDNAELYMQKVDGKWAGYGVGTGFENLYSQHPELFQ
jgi:hypothetical protein